MMGTVLVVALALAGCGKSDAPDAKSSGAVAEASSKDLFDALDDSSDLSESARLIKAAGLEKTFEGVGSYTLFAPTNDAIKALPEADR
ncbi:fasciclin domain-containing protein, partial [Enterococcus sp. HPCN18]